MVKYYYDKHKILENPVWSQFSGNGSAGDTPLLELINRTMSNKEFPTGTSFVIQESYEGLLTSGSLRNTINNTAITLTSFFNSIESYASRYELDPEGYYQTYFTSNGALFRFSVKRYSTTNILYKFWYANSTTHTKGNLITSNLVAENGAYPSNGVHTDGYWYVRKGLVNATPTVNLSAPTDTNTLYENTAYTISGNATDADNGNIVNIRYSINDGTARALATGISDGTTAIPFAKTLAFKNGKLFDGDTAITDSLAEGTAHMLRVWATDDQGATSTIISRSFYAVPNRAPSLTVDAPQPSGTINSDKFAITGTCSDIDGNEVTVAYRINGANSVQIYKGQGGAWSFDVALSALQVGANSIVIEVTDSYNFKATKTVRLNKNEIKTPVNTATARYKLTPPKGSATGVLLWVRRTETLQLDAKISMVLKGEQEQYFAPTDEVTTTQVSQGIVEDEFIFETAEAKTDIVLKLEMTKTHDNDAITLITGVFN